MSEWDIVSEEQNITEQTKSTDDKGFVPSVLGDFGERISTITSPETYKDMSLGVVEAPLRVAGQVAGGINDVIGQGLRSAYKTIFPKHEQQYVKDIGNDIKSVADYWGVTPIIGNAVKYVGDKYNQFTQDYPNVSKDVGAVTNIAMAAPLVKGTVATAKSTLPVAKAIAKEPVNIISDIKSIISPMGQEEIDAATGNIITKYSEKAGIVPSRVRGQMDIQSFKEAEKKAVPAIIKEKNNLVFTDGAGNVVSKGTLPETVDEWSQAIPQVKDTIMSKITGELKKAGKEGVRVPTQNAVDVIEAIEKSPMMEALKTKPQYDSIINTMEEMKSRYKNIGSFSPEAANADISALNKIIKSNTDPLADFIYKGIAKGQRESLDNTINALNGGNFQELKTTWGSLNQIEQRVSQKANALAGRSGGVTYWDMASFAEGMAGLMTGNPKLIFSGIATKLGVTKIKEMMGSNKAVERLFNKSEKMMRRNDIRSETGKTIKGIFEEQVTPTKLPKSPYTLRNVRNIQGIE